MYWTIIIVMIVVNIHEVKAKLSEYLEMMERGERVVICRRNRPVAELRPVASARTGARPIGGARGRFVVPPSFFDPLPDEVLDAFSGESESPSVGAEPSPTYGKAKARGRKRR
jgi:prevent-host-death family protein